MAKKETDYIDTNYAIETLVFMGLQDRNYIVLNETKIYVKHYSDEEISIKIILFFRQSAKIQIHEECEQIQKLIKEEIETLTIYKVRRINIRIHFIGSTRGRDKKDA